MTTLSSFCWIVTLEGDDWQYSPSATNLFAVMKIWCSRYSPFLFDESEWQSFPYLRSLTRECSKCGWADYRATVTFNAVACVRRINIDLWLLFFWLVWCRGMNTNSWLPESVYLFRSMRAFLYSLYLPGLKLRNSTQNSYAKWIKISHLAYGIILTYLFYSKNKIIGRAGIIVIAVASNKNILMFCPGTFLKYSNLLDKIFFD